MVSKRLTFEILASDAAATKAFGKIAGSAKSEMKKVSTALDDTRTAGQKMADGLSAAADQLEAEYAGLQSASERLASALGPEFAAKAEQGVDGLVLDLRRAGLTFDEIEADADGLAMAIKKLDDVELGKVRAEVGQIDDGMRKVGVTTDKSRSVMANFAGNAAQDLPVVSGSMGALNVAVGQFAEYAAESNIGMKQFLKTAGGMAAAAGAAAALAYVLKGFADEKAFEKERVKSWADEVREGKSAIEILNDEMRETEKIERGTFGGAQDITRAVARVGLTMESFNALVLKGEDAWTEWAEATLRSGGSALDVTVIMDGLKDAHNGLADAETASAARAKVFGSEILDMSSAMERGNHAAEEFAATLAGDARAAMEANNGQFVAAAEAEGRAARALRDYNSAWDALTGEIDQDNAMIGLIQGFDDLAEAHKATAEAGKKGAAEQKAAFLAEGTAINGVKQQVIDYGRDILGLPAERVTEFLAMIDEGDFAAVEQRLAILSRNRTANISIVSRGGAGYFEGPRGATGGVVTKPTIAMIGEAGPEAVVPLNRMPGAFPLGTGSSIGQGGGGDTYITLVVEGSVVTERNLIDAVHEGLLVKQGANYTLGFQ